MELLKLCVALLAVTLAILVYFWQRHLNYWAARGIVHDKPHPIFGNVKEVGRTQPLRQPLREFYQKYKNVAPLGGFYFGLRRAIIPFDLELIKTLLIKDFNNFAHRGNYYNERDDPLSAHLFNLDGPKWRHMRTKLTPTFTSGKMKFMFPTLVEVAERFIAVMQELTKPGSKGDEVNIEVKELLARFTTDVIGSCAFGLECNSLRDPNAKFRVMGQKSFTQPRHIGFARSLIQTFPNLARMLHVRTTRDDVNEFFSSAVRETVAYRERERVQRNDFLNLLIELKNNKEMSGLTIDEIAAEAFVFFLAGFETSSSTMGFALYELAVNQDIQEKARLEIQAMFKRYDGKLTYEGMRELKYLQQILHETLRMYSIASALTRVAVNDYPVPNTNIVIARGTLVVIPADAIHSDPDIYPNPDIFDPTRFAPEAVAKRHAMSWLPFGEGPRNCIGFRFGEMQALVGLAMLLRNFRFSPGKLTKIPIEIKVQSLGLATTGVVLKVEKIMEQ